MDQRLEENIKTSSTTLGTLSIHIISDGIFSLDGGILFGAVPRMLWGSKVIPDHENRVVLGLNSLLIQTGTKNILVDTGIGNKLSLKSKSFYNVSVKTYSDPVDGEILNNDFSIKMTDKALLADYRTSGYETKLLVISPESNNLFSFEGDFEIVEIIVANSHAEVAVEIPNAGNLNEMDASMITEFSLSTAYPNPFNPTTIMTLAVPTAGYASVQVYNLAGQIVATLVSGYMEANTYNTVTWDASNVSSGMYFVKAEAEDFVSTQKLMLVK